jgi:hypothetical protein
LFLRLEIDSERTTFDALSTITISSYIQQIVFSSTEQLVSRDYRPGDYFWGQLDSRVVDLSMEHLPSVGLEMLHQDYTEHVSYLPRLRAKNLVSTARASFARCLSSVSG